MRAWLFGMVAGWAALPAAADDYSAWSDSTRVMLNTTAAGADVSADQSDFPVLVRLTDAAFPFSEAKADGSDLRFADAGNNPLPFELERFDAAAKRAEVWVKVPVVKGNDASQYLKMFWGNAAAASVSSGAAVFTAAAGWGGAWHLGEDGNVDAAGYKDASAAGNHGQGQALNAGSDMAGNVGQATNFLNANAQGVYVPHHASLHPAAGLTVEAWIKSNTQGAYRRFLGKPFTSLAAPWNEYSLEADIDGNKAKFSLTLDGTEAGVTARTVMANGAWYHVAGTWDGANQRIYVNGVPESTLVRSGTVPDYGQTLAIGKYALDAFSNFDGAVDEARISQRARGADWIRLSYANQRADQSLVSFQRFSTCQSRFAIPGDTAVDEGAAVVLAATADCATAYSWSVESGPAPRILDPGVKVLSLTMPRVAGDTAVVFRFTADFGGTSSNGQVRVVLKESIPDPLFTLPASQSWTGSAPLTLKPVISNAAALAASREPTLRYAWTVAGGSVDTALTADGLILSNPAPGASLAVGLCLDNRGAVLCKETTVQVGPATSLRRPAKYPSFSLPAGDGRDAKGRYFPAPAPR